MIVILHLKLQLFKLKPTVKITNYLKKHRRADLATLKYKSKRCYYILVKNENTWHIAPGRNRGADRWRVGEHGES